MAADRDDAGFTLLETLMSLLVMGTVMASLAVFFSRSMTVTSRQGDRQVAAQLATDGVDQLRKVPGCKLRNLCGSSFPAADTQAVGGVTYTRTYATRAVISPDLLPVVVTVSWPGCGASACTFSASTLVSTSAVEPVFEDGP